MPSHPRCCCPTSERSNMSGHLRVPVLLVSGPGRRTESLRVLLRAMSDVEVVGQVESLLAAWQMILERRPILVLVDLGLPKNESYLLLRHIANERPEIACLALAADEEQAHAARSAGVTAVLSVPVTLFRLRAGIEEAIKGTQPAPL